MVPPLDWEEPNPSAGEDDLPIDADLGDVRLGAARAVPARILIREADGRAAVSRQAASARREWRAALERLPVPVRKERIDPVVSKVEKTGSGTPGRSWEGAQ